MIGGLSILSMQLATICRQSRMARGKIPCNTKVIIAIREIILQTELSLTRMAVRASRRYATVRAAIAASDLKTAGGPEKGRRKNDASAIPAAWPAPPRSQHLHRHASNPAMGS